MTQQKQPECCGQRSIIDYGFKRWVVSCEKCGKFSIHTKIEKAIINFNKKEINNDTTNQTA